MAEQILGLNDQEAVNSRTIILAAIKGLLQTKEQLASTAREIERLIRLRPHRREPLLLERDEVNTEIS